MEVRALLHAHGVEDAAVGINADEGVVVLGEVEHSD